MVLYSKVQVIQRLRANVTEIICREVQFQINKEQFPLQFQACPTRQGGLMNLIRPPPYLWVFIGVSGAKPPLIFFFRGGLAPLDNSCLRPRYQGSIEECRMHLNCKYRMQTRLQFNACILVGLSACKPELFRQRNYISGGRV